ncbi:MAG: alpha-glucosidase C-terminal domain-containing protein [Prevotellaceae bacterium]|nr:alpha-glucosidase C-terminal domain-containing protein [Prevotellaceae bacterium]
MKNIRRITLLCLFGAFVLASCTPSASKDSASSGKNASSATWSGDTVVYEVNPATWSSSMVIYEVNVRQFTPEGTFKAFQEHITRLKELGVGILWFMPISPIGKVDRKGTLGSYYSVSDYTVVNPEFGTVEDFKSVVDEAHRLGMKVLIDWVANHTSRDHAWIKEHPDWYRWDKKGESPIGPYDWSDAAQLNYESKDMQKAMVESMKFWLTDVDIDGFRCDVAGLARDYVTEEQALEFWEYARQELDKVKPVFMLAEDEGLRALTSKAFDANYSWELHHIMNQIAQGEGKLKDLRSYFERESKNFPRKVYRMQFTSNHDENSWNGTEFMRMGDAAKMFAVFTYVVPGFPLIYSGQEVGNRRCLEFFEKDVVDWTDRKEYTPFYKTLNSLKTDYSALWNGVSGADVQWVENSEPKKVLSFVREDENGKVFCVFNLAKEVVKNVELEGNTYYGDYVELFSNMPVSFSATPNFILNPWEYRVYTSKK